MNRVTKNVYLVVSTLMLLLLGVSVGRAAPVPAHTNTAMDWPGGLIIDHNCIEIEKIPLEYIQAAQSSIKYHYAHTSHGGQITTGLERIESSNDTFSVSIGSKTLPDESGVLCMYDGNGDHSYITPDLYWQTAEGLAITHNTLDNNPSLNVSMWSWCTQLNYYDADQTQEYLDAMASLEADYPDVTFVYMTGNAQAGDEDGYNRWLRNEMIRDYCRTNNKVLFDFADLDSWHNGVQATYEYSTGGTTYTIPIEHEDFNGDEAGHTTYTSCEQKAKAFWWMVAMLAGWVPDGYTSSTSSTDTTSDTTTNSGTTSSGQTTTGFIADLLSNQTLLVSAGIIGVLLIAAIVVAKRK